MKLVIDRFEGEYAVCEAPDLSRVNIPRGELGENAREGDVLELIDGRYVIDRAAADERRKRIRKKLERLMKE